MESKMGKLFLTNSQINAIMALLTKSGHAGKAKAVSMFLFHLATWAKNLVEYNWLKHTEDGLDMLNEDNLKELTSLESTSNEVHQLSRALAILVDKSAPDADGKKAWDAWRSAHKDNYKK